MLRPSLNRCIVSKGGFVINRGNKLFRLNERVMRILLLNAFLILRVSLHKLLRLEKSMVQREELNDLKKVCR